MIPPLPDYSEFLKQEGMLEYIESEWQKNKHIHQAQANVVNNTAGESDTVIEIGCATGNLAALIKTNNYIGVDKNHYCIGMAAFKNKGKSFVCDDIRTLSIKPANVVCAFAIMKHFGLHEWDNILSKIVSLSTDLVIIDMPITLGDTIVDDGELHGHHHIWMNGEEFRKRIGQSGLEIVSQDNTNAVEPIFICRKK